MRSTNMKEKPDRMNSGERLLIELNLAVKYLTEAFDKFQKSSIENYSRIDASKVNVAEFNLLKNDADKLHTNLITRIERLETSIEAIQKDSATLAGQIRLAAWIIGIGMVILGIVAPVLTAMLIK